MTTSTDPLGSTAVWPLGRFWQEANASNNGSANFEIRIPKQFRTFKSRSKTAFNRSQPPDHFSSFGFPFRLSPNRNGRRSLELAPADPGALQRAQDRLPDAITEHWSVNQPHRQNPPRPYYVLFLQDAGEAGQNDIHSQKRDHERQQRPPCAERKRNEQKHIDQRCEADQNDLEEPHTR